MLQNIAKFVGGGVVGVALTIGLIGGGAVDPPLPADKDVVSVEAPKALAGDAKCPSPPRTGGAVFVKYGKGVVTTENPQGGGQNAVLETLNCDYKGEWSYTIDANGKEQLQNYAGPGAIPAPRVFDNTLEINRVLADLN